MVVEIWDHVLRVLDNGVHAACLLGVDFKKAFNCMDHAHCLRQLRSLGASESSLKGRSMQITIDGIQGGSRPIVRGRGISLPLFLLKGRTLSSLHSMQSDYPPALYHFLLAYDMY